MRNQRVQKIFQRLLTAGFAVAITMLSCYALKFLPLATAETSPNSIELLKARSLATLAKHNGQAAELVIEATAYVRKFKRENPKARVAAKLEKAIQRITYGSAGLSNPQIADELELLQAIAKQHNEPSAQSIA